MSRPEHVAPPEVFYNEKEAKKYAVNSRMINIQTKMSERALELLNFQDDGSKLILDIGCGTGLSGQVLDKNGHFWVGLDISQSMLEVCKERECTGDALLWDMGTGFSFRPGVFDGVISISAVQWLCNADTNKANPVKRIKRFFNTLYMCIARGGRAVLQFYPENPHQMELLTSAAMKAGFTGGVLIDYPHSTKAKKYFLVLFAGMLPNQQMPKPLGMDDEVKTNIRYDDKRRTMGNNKGRKKKVEKGSKEWILNKKQRREMQGKQTAGESKYTGRKRKPRF